MIFAAMPRPPPLEACAPNGDSAEDGLGLEVSVREGGGAIAAPPVVAVE